MKLWTDNYIQITTAFPIKFKCSRCNQIVNNGILNFIEHEEECVKNKPQDSMNIIAHIRRVIKSGVTL